MYCPNCGKEAPANNRFCPGCGLRLEAVAEVLANEPAQLERERQTTTGLSLIMTAALLALLYLIIFGAVTLPHMDHQLTFFLIWASFVAVSLVTGVVGFIKLLRSNFLRELKERNLRTQLAQMEQKRKELTATDGDRVVETRPLRGNEEMISVAEGTTREIGPKAVDAQRSAQGQ